jgi:hypothetical protein
LFEPVVILEPAAAPNTILLLMKTLQHKNSKYQITCHINNMDHQSSTSECGVYSIYFNIFTLFNKYSDLNQTRIDDNTIHMFRDILFNKINNKDLKDEQI